MADPKVRTPQPTIPPPQERGSTFGWAIAAIVAVVAILAVAFIAMPGSSSETDSRLSAMIDQPSTQPKSR